MWGCKATDMLAWLARRVVVLTCQAYFQSTCTYNRAHSGCQWCALDVCSVDDPDVWFFIYVSFS